MTTRRALAGRVAVCGLLLALGACGPGGAGRGAGEPLDLEVDGVDRIEVREVLVTDDQVNAVPSADRYPSPFGVAAVPVGDLDPASPAGSELLAAVSEARVIDLGNVVYDLSNPDLDVVLVADGTELAHLGYYRQAGRYGQYGVDSRWMDDAWRLLAMTDELPDAVTAGP